MIDPTAALLRAGLYGRVSSDEQRENQTIRTQQEAITRYLEAGPEFEVAGWYLDDGVSGTIPMASRPEGSRLIRDAAAGLFQVIVVYRFDRIGRDDIDPLIVWRELERLGVRVFSITEGWAEPLMYAIRIAMGANDRRMFLERSAHGMNRAAREGRYTGGIVSLGYRVEGKKPHARLVPDDSIMWSDRTAADVVRMIYRWLAVDGGSCRWIAEELNRLGVPTHYAREGRGVRGNRTQGLWRAGHVRNLVVNTVYKGELQYGRRSSRLREVISAAVEPLVTPETWHAAQDALARNRISAKNTRRTYVLRSVIRCGLCGLTYCGVPGRPDIWWYRCNGQIVERGPFERRCAAQALRGPELEAEVWRDIERWLRNPSDLLDELDVDGERDAGRAVAEAESVTLATALVTLDAQRAKALDLNIRGRLTDDELEAALERIASEHAEIERRLESLEPPAEPEEQPQAAIDLLAELRRRLDEGLADAERQEVVRLLVRRIVVHTEVLEPRKKRARIVVEYRFPNLGVVATDTGTGSWRRQA